MIPSDTSDITFKWPVPFNEIPKEVFQREDIFEQELERIFYGPEWHLIGHRAEVPNPGDYKTIQIGRAPILILHGKDGKIRIFSNSCTHRGVQIATCSRGHASSLQCPYHRWNFSLQGDLIGAPGMSGFPESFRKEDYGLKQLRSGEVFGTLFCTLSSQTPALSDWLGDTKAYIGKALNEDGRLSLLGYQKVVFDTNWKAYNDNEGYHGPLLHAAFRLLDFPKAEGVQFMTTQAHKVNSVHYGGVKQTRFLKDFSILETRDPKAEPQNTIVNLFPMSLIVRNLDVINLRYAIPLESGKTEVHYAYFAHEDDDDDLKSHRIRQASNLAGPSGFITLEDGAVFNRLQIGQRSSGNVAFQKGYKGEISPPYELDKGDEAGNLIRWEKYRKLMGFDRG